MTQMPSATNIKPKLSKSKIRTGASEKKTRHYPDSQHACFRIDNDKAKCDNTLSKYFIVCSVSQLKEMIRRLSRLIRDMLILHAPQTTKEPRHCEPCSSMSEALRLLLLTRPIVSSPGSCSKSPAAIAQEGRQHRRQPGFPTAAHVQDSPAPAVAQSQRRGLSSWPPQASPLPRSPTPLIPSAPSQRR